MILIMNEYTPNVTKLIQEIYDAGDIDLFALKQHVILTKNIQYF